MGCVLRQPLLSSETLNLLKSASTGRLTGNLSSRGYACRDVFQTRSSCGGHLERNQYLRSSAEVCPPPSLASHCLLPGPPTRFPPPAGHPNIQLYLACWTSLISPARFFPSRRQSMMVSGTISFAGLVAWEYSAEVYRVRGVWQRSFLLPSGSSCDGVILSGEGGS